MYQNVVEYIKIYGKSPFSIKFQKKKISLGGPRTHEKEQKNWWKNMEDLEGQILPTVI